MKKLAASFIVGCTLTGCASSPLDLVTGAIGSKPEITAQAGATNTKQTLGLTANTDSSHETTSNVRDSNVGSLDTSTGKKLSASSISASTITADRIEIRNGSDEPWLSWSLVGALAGVVVALIWLLIRAIRNRKAP